MANSKLKETAYHEAGHAVVSVLTRCPVKKATIVPDGECLGEVFDYGSPPSIRDDIYGGVHNAATRRWLFRELMIFHAGVIAAARGMGVKPKSVAPGGRGDFDGLADDALKAFEDYQAKVDQSYTEAEKLLVAHWEAVEAVAAALLEHRTLSGKRVRAIVMENGGCSYLVRGGQKSAEIKNRGARATTDSQGRIHIPTPDENEVWVWHEQPITVEAM